MPIASSDTQNVHQLVINLAFALIKTRPTYARQTSSSLWNPVGLAQGDTGVALLLGQMDLCFPNSDWDKHAHQAIKIASGNLHQNISLSLFSGLSGISYATLLLSKDRTRYERMLYSLDELFVQKANTLNNSPNSMNSCDLISGSSGILRYLLCRNDNPQFDRIKNHILLGLVEMTKTRNALPCWFLSPTDEPSESFRKDYPHGSLNCGMAHGIPGPLAALSLAKIHGVAVDGQEAAIRKIADWLLLHRLDDKYGMNWPAAVAVKNIGTKEKPKYIQTTEGLHPTHTGWCYGPSGVAVALWHAGVALKDENYKNKAIEIMRAVFARPISERKLFNPGLCHGFAGQLQIALRFYKHTGLEEFANEARRLVQLLIEKYYDPNTLLGFQAQDGHGNKIDQAGLLDGAPGVILALLAACTDVEPKWDQIFMLS